MDSAVVNLKKPVLLPFVLGSLILFSVLLSSIYHEESSRIDREFVDTRQTLSEVYHSIVDDQAEKLAAIVDTVAQDEALATAFAARDRERLRKLAEPVFERLRERYRITHLYFHDPNRVNFLRLHQPDHFGDVIDRFTAKSAQRTGEPSHGLELTPPGTLTFRAVLPWRRHGALLGYLEIGEEAKGLATRLHRMFDMEIGVLIKKSLLSGDVWQSGLEMPGRKATSGLPGEEVLISRSGSMVPTALSQRIITRSGSLPETPKRLSLGERKYITGTIPLKDVAERDVGRLLLMRDITARVATSHNVITNMVVASLFVGPVLLGLFFIYLTRAERQLKDWRRRVTDEGHARTRLHEEHLRELEDAALYDTLTGLLNRKFLDEQLAHAVEAAIRDGERFMLVLLNIQRVNEINVTLGHETGDTLLRQVADRLKQGLPDALVVARAGGDEFAVALPAPDTTDTADVVTMIRHTLSPTFYVNGISLDMLANIGIAICPDHAQDAVTLLRRADVAMRQAKRHRENYAVYQSSLDPHGTRRLTLLGDLRQAIQDDSLALYYQPQVSMKANRVVAVEALVRWTHPRLGPISAAEFIPMAEQTGVIKELTRWVLKQAVTQQAIWLRQGLDLSMCVNLSAHDLQDNALPAYVADLIAQSTGAANRFKNEYRPSSRPTGAPFTLRMPP